MLRELRFLFNPAHTHVIDYLKKEFVGLQKNNVSLLIREGKNCEARLFARYDKGVEKEFKLTNNVGDAVKEALSNK